jgi:uncharacterized protein YegP (UPF0339 family)
MADSAGDFRLYSKYDKTHDTWEWRWDLTDPMGHVICTAGGFPDRDAVARSIDWVKANAATCGVIEPPGVVAIG